MKKDCNYCGYYGENKGYVFTECCSTCDRDGLNPYNLFKCNVCNGSGFLPEVDENEIYELAMKNDQTFKSMLPQNGYFCR